MCLLIKAKIQKRIRGEQRTELEVRISKILLLSDMRNEIKKVVLRVNLPLITTEFIDSIEKVCKKHKGKTQLTFNIGLPEEKISLEMFSRNYSFSLNNEMLDYFNENDLEFKLN